MKWLLALTAVSVAAAIPGLLLRDNGVRYLE